MPTPAFANISKPQARRLLGHTPSFSVKSYLSYNSCKNKPDFETITVDADKRKLKQVMFNLLSNAVKFTPDGGFITIEGKKDGQGLIISVADTGIGIPPEKQIRIFEEFYQVKGGSVDKTPGTGLGLAITKRIVTMHCGRIWFTSEGAGKGATFYFTLPLVLKKKCPTE